MSVKFRSVDRTTAYLLPPSIDEWLPEGHLARFVADVVSQLDTSAMENCYSGRCSDAWHPKVLISLLFYGYATGIFSSRKLERSTHDSVAFRYLCANHHPDHDSIATFRRRFLPELESLFVQILHIGREMELVKLGNVSLDGTKMKANASKHKALSWAYACKLEAQFESEVKELMRLANEADASDLPDDKREMEPVVEKLTKLPDELGEIKNVVADTGYYSEHNVKICEQHKLKPLIAYGRQPHHPPLAELIARDESGDAFVSDDPVQRMKDELKGEIGRAIYAKRKSTVEPVFGIIRHVMGFRQFSMGGLEKAKVEWSIVCMAWNIRRLFTLQAA